MTEAEQLAVAAKELKDLRGIIKTQQREIEIWREISSKAYARIDELESEGAAQVLKRERDQWRASWRNCTRRLGNCIEHLGLDYLGKEPNADASLLLPADLSPHDLRKTALTDLAAHGEAKAVQGIAGHADIDTTMRLYARRRMTAMRAAVEEMEKGRKVG